MGAPRPATLPTPGPGDADDAAGVFSLFSFDGGASTVIATKCSPRKITNPSVRFSCFFSESPPSGLYFTLRYSSV